MASTIRSLLGDDPDLSERRMFGGICFMRNGHMLCGASGTGHYLMRVGKTAYEDLLAQPDAAEMDFTGRTMKGYLYIDTDDPERLRFWLERAGDHVATLPPKPPRSAKAKKSSN